MALWHPTSAVGDTIAIGNVGAIDDMAAVSGGH